MKLLTKLLVFALICVLLTGCACAPRFENPVPKPALSEPAPSEPAPTEPAPTEPAVRTLPPEEITMDMFRLAEHNPNGEHCTTCSPFCMEHCFKSKCILHCQEYMGLLVTVPSGELYVVGQANSNNEEEIAALKECRLDNITILTVGKDETFTVCGIRYVIDTAGSPDPSMLEGSECDGPFTLERMSNFCSAGWINTIKDGILYVILGETTYAVLPYTLEVSYKHP